MTLRTPLAVAALVLVGGCAKVHQCEAREEARHACLDEAAAAGVDTTPYEGDVDCSDYGSITRIDPILGPIQAASDPDFECQRQVWEDADCTTADGLSIAVSATWACDE
jgi:hypothetical protein